MSVPLTKPRLRGWLHLGMAPLVLIAGLVFTAFAPTLLGRVGSAIYTLAAVQLFGTSAAYHRGTWSERTNAVFRRIDHSNIFVFIAGTYTPLCLLGMANQSGERLLLLVWIAASAGVLRALVWPHAPRAVTSGLFVVVGWLVVAYLPDARAAFDAATFTWLVAGGVWFTVGAVIYATRWPDPWPRVFGFHEVFHVLIIVGCACHFVAVARCAL